MNCETWREMSSALWELGDAAYLWPGLTVPIFIRWREVYRQRAEHVLTCKACIEREALEIRFGTTRNDLLTGQIPDHTNEPITR